jgi:hypothetical protein
MNLKTQQMREEEGERNNTTETKKRYGTEIPVCDRQRYRQTTNQLASANRHKLYLIAFELAQAFRAQFSLLRAAHSLCLDHLLALPRLLLPPAPLLRDQGLLWGEEWVK